MLEKDYPILEFDEDPDAFIRPQALIKPMDISQNCVLCFFSEAIEKILNEFPHKEVSRFKAESMKLPIYEVEYMEKKIILLQAGVGAPIAAAQIEELYALGCRKFITCGSCGVLDENIAVDQLLIPVSAVRDEGTSYHYIKPSREISADLRVIEIIEKTLTGQNIPYIKAKTWTTDAFYRETPAKIKLRKKEGCVTVDMEAAAYMAVCRYNNAEFGQILYAGDSLAGENWDSRDFNARWDTRDRVLRLAMDVCIAL